MYNSQFHLHFRPKVIFLGDSCEGSGWWSLLHQTLEEEEKGKQSKLYKVVVSTILQRGHSVPAWLFDSYKVIIIIIESSNYYYYY